MHTANCTCKDAGYRRGDKGYNIIDTGNSVIQLGYRTHDTVQCRFKVTHKG